MTDIHSKLLHPRTEFDKWQTLTIGIFMSLTGYAFMVGLPVISTSWVNNLGFSEVQVGRLVGADLGGLAMGAVIAALLVARVDRRYLAIAAGLTAITGNALSIAFPEYEILLWLRLMAGIGAGVYTGIAQATIAGHSRPAFAFSIELLAFAGSQGAELKVLPQLSIEGIYMVFIAAFIIGLLFVSYLPRRPRDKTLDVDIDVEEADGHHRVKHQHVPAYVPWLVLIAIVLTYINIGAYWTYIELSTVDSDAAPDWVSSMLWMTSIFSVVG